MARTLRRWQAILLGVPALAALAMPAWSGAQQPAMPAPDKAMAKQAPVNVAAPAPRPDDRPYPINLPTALKLASVRDLDIELASAQIRIAAAQFDRAKVLWLPTILIGGDYFRQ